MVVIIGAIDGLGRQLAATGDDNTTQSILTPLYILPSPVFELQEPKTAPTEMLDQVCVNTEGQSLESQTSLGTIAAEMHWTMGEQTGDSEEHRGDFFAALDAGLDPDVESNPLATQSYPYTILPNGALYQIVVRTPLEAVNVGWPEERTRALAGSQLS
jgi:hypothetical protein